MLVRKFQDRKFLVINPQIPTFLGEPDRKLQIGKFSIMGKRNETSILKTIAKLQKSRPQVCLDEFF
jgi:hypothetical protein